MNILYFAIIAVPLTIALRVLVSHTAARVRQGSNS
jgi:hypothetical protein